MCDDYIFGLMVCAYERVRVASYAHSEIKLSHSSAPAFDASPGIGDDEAQGPRYWVVEL